MSYSYEQGTDLLSRSTLAKDKSQPLTIEKVQVSGITVNYLNRSVQSDTKQIETTGLEFNLLALLMNNAGKVVSRDEVAKEIFNRPLSHCDKSINSHIANIRKKLCTTSSRVVINTLRGRGYIFVIG